MGASDDRIETRVIHAGAGPRVDGALITPIFQSASFVMQGSEDYHNIRYEEWDLQAAENFSNFKWPTRGR